MKTYSSAIERLDRIRDILDHHGIDYADIAREVKSIFRDFNYKKHPYKTKIAGFVRAVSKNEENWFDHVDKFSYPPSGVLTTFGRCNCPHKPVFYCSNDNVVPILEIRPKVDSIVAVSHWCGRAGQEINFLTASVGTRILIDNLTENDSLRKALLQDDIFRNDTPQVIKDIDEYIGKVFTEDGDNNNLYWFTNAITEALLGLTSPTSTIKLDGLVYPSLASNFKGCNFAFRTEFADKNLILCGVSLYKYVKEYNLKRVKWLTKPGPKGDNLIWEDIVSDDNLFNFSPDAPTEFYINLNK